ncbi:hypothetical protein [Flavobacterium sp. SM2513]|uniref:hypothetical protein n=1 Tax=Flavobacterium sp. SM2513 TaxID=3424766 RepID=UPI003D7FAF79
MKEWFKYEFGYVNIDSENLYLTNSGNWSEIIDLQEQTKQITHENDRKSSLTLGFIIVVVCFFGFLLYKNYIAGKVGILLIAVTVGLGYKMYAYLKTEIGAKFKIPLVKITNITEIGQNVEISFINGDGDSVVYKLHRIDKRGIGLMRLLKKP